MKNKDLRLLQERIMKKIDKQVMPESKTYISALEWVLWEIRGMIK